jgi:Arc/MetJ family transcription regulator
MRTTLNIDEDLLKQANQLTGITEKTALVKAGLEALIARESARRLALLGGSQPDLEMPPRRRRKPAK